MTAEKQLREAKNEITLSIKSALLTNGLSQEEVRKKLGVGKVQMSRAVNGNSDRNSVEIRKKIYDFLKIKNLA